MRLTESRSGTRAHREMPTTPNTSAYIYSVELRYVDATPAQIREVGFGRSEPGGRSREVRVGRSHSGCRIWELAFVRSHLGFGSGSSDSVLRFGTSDSGARTRELGFGRAYSGARIREVRFGRSNPTLVPHLYCNSRHPQYITLLTKYIL